MAVTSGIINHNISTLSLSSGAVSRNHRWSWCDTQTVRLRMQRMFIVMSNEQSWLGLLQSCYWANHTWGVCPHDFLEEQGHRRMHFVSSFVTSDTRYSAKGRAGSLVLLPKFLICLTLWATYSTQDVSRCDSLFCICLTSSPTCM